MRIDGLAGRDIRHAVGPRPLDLAVIQDRDARTRHSVELHALLKRECRLGSPVDLHGGEDPALDEGRSFFRRRDLFPVGGLLVGACQSARP